MIEPLPESPTVGVYALTYNHEDFIVEAIESVLTQGWPTDRLQFVLLDDGSTDSTPERVRPYERHLTYVRQENQGINAAVNRLVGMVDGDVLVPLSGDDMWPRGKLERVVAYFRDHPDVGMVHGDMELIDQHGNVLKTSVWEKSGPPPRGQIAGPLLRGNLVSGGAMAVRGALRPAMVPIPQAAAWEDWWFAWALTNAAPVDYLDAIVYRYRRHRNNYMFGLTRRDRQAALDRTAAEIPFRRYLLGNARPGTCTPRELLHAAEHLRQLLVGLNSEGREPDAVLQVAEAEHAAAERLAADAMALANTSTVLTAFAAARALAADPNNDDAYRLLHDVAGDPPTPLMPIFDDVRAVTVFAEAEELAREPALLSAYVNAVGENDDVTLVTVARGWDEERLAAEFGRVVDRVAGAQAVDILAFPADTATWMTAMTQADCALGLHQLPVPGVPRFDDTERLREYVEQRHRDPAASIVTPAAPQPPEGTCVLAGAAGRRPRTAYCGLCATAGAARSGSSPRTSSRRTSVRQPRSPT